MAVPAISNNTPSAGHISWAAFTIQLNGVAYSVPAASTDQRWVWWEFRNGAPVVMSGPEVPSTLIDEDLVLFANKNGIGFRVQSANFIDGELLVDGSILASAIGANQIVTEHMAAGTINGDRIMAGTIESSKVIVGGGDNRLLEDALAAYVQSRGQNLVTNGTGALKDLTNWSTTGATVDLVDVPVGASASYAMPAGQSSRFLEELVPVDPNRIFEINLDQRQTAGAGRFYFFFYPHDAYGLAISPAQYMAVPDTLTTLAVELKPGDTTVTLTSSANWYGTAAKPAGTQINRRSIIFWDYVDQGGKAWPELTYSRNVSAQNYWADGGINGNVITLSAPYSGPVKPAGTKLSNGASGGSFMYIGAVNRLGTSAWQRITGRTEKGVHTSGIEAPATTKFPMMTASAKVGFLVNYPVSGSTPDPASRQSFANLSVSDITLAVEAYDRWAPSGVTTIDGGKITARTITADRIAADAITANEVATNAITANEIAADTITANEIAANTITSNELSADAITANMLTANDALINALKVSDLSTVNLASVNISGGTIAIATSSTGINSEEFSGTTTPTGWSITNGGPDATVPGFSFVNSGIPIGSNNGAALKLDHGVATTRQGTLDFWAGSALSDTAPAVDVELTSRFQITVPIGATYNFEMTEFILRATADPAVTGNWDGLTFRLSGDQSSPISIHTVVGGQADYLGSVIGPAMEANVWQNIKIRVIGGRIEVSFWKDGVPEPQAKIFQSNVNLQPGLVGVRYSDTPILQQNATGLKVYFDTFNVETFSSGFKVAPDGVVDIANATVDELLAENVTVTNLLSTSDATVSDLLSASNATVTNLLSASNATVQNSLSAGSFSSPTLTGDLARLGQYCQSVTDWNNANVNGFFRGQDAANSPTSGWLMGYVIAHTALWCTQIVHSFTSDTSSNYATYRRELNNGTWGAWSVVAGGDTGWLTPAFAATWSNLGGAWPPLGYRKLNGVVYLRGMVKTTADLPAGNLGAHANRVIFTLPVGYRPANSMHVPATNSTNNFARINVESDGQVALNWSVGDQPANGWWSLDGMSFIADA